MSEYNTTQGYELDWDSEIQADEKEYITLPEGVYPFRVNGFDRGLYDGSAKVPKCKMATLHLVLDGGPLGEANVDERLYLHSDFEWKLSSFFASIGLKKKGQRVTMNWNAVPGAAGMVKVVVNTYTNKNGQERTNNRVERFIPAEEESGHSQAPDPGYPPAQQAQPEPQQTAMGGWPQRTRMADYQAGKF